MTDTELFPEARYDLDVERGASNVERGAGAALMLGGLFGLAAGTRAKSLSVPERRGAASSGVAIAVVGGLMAVRPTAVIAPARRSRGAFPMLCYATAVGSTAFGGGDETPAYFPAVMLTALSSGIIADPDWGLASSSLVALGYLAGCGRALAAKGKPLTREAWANVGLAVGFVGAGIGGAIAGELSLQSRALTDYGQREIEARETASSRHDVDQVAGEVRTLSREFLGLLPAVTTMFEGDESVGHATAKIATALASLHGADARLDPPVTQRRRGTLRLLRNTATRYNLRKGNVRVALKMPRLLPILLPWEITTALNDSMIALVQNSANARRSGDPPVEVNVTIERVRIPRVSGRKRPCIRLTVEDKAGGKRISEQRWGTGLHSCRDVAGNLGGSFELHDGPHGLRAVMEVPYVKGDNDASASSTFAAYFEQGRDDALSRLRWVTAAQAAFIFLAEERPGSLRRNLAALGGLIGASHLPRLASGRTRSALEAALSVAAMGAFEGPGRPPLCGLACVLCASASGRGDAAIGMAGAIGGFLAALAVAGPERFGAGLGPTVGDRPFPLVGAIGGIPVWRALLNTRTQEDALANDVWRRQILSDLALASFAKHHFLEPLEDALGEDRWARLIETPLGSSLHAIDQRLSQARERLERLLAVGNPLQTLQHQLARLLAPAPVLMLGTKPTRVHPREGQEIEAIRYRLTLIRVGEGIAERVRQHLPPTLLGASRLQEVQLHVEPGDEKTAIEVIQVPFRAIKRRRERSRLAEACRDAGGDVKPRAGEGFTVSVDNTALG
jgi:hypothetical protein